MDEGRRIQQERKSEKGEGKGNTRLARGLYLAGVGNDQMGTLWSVPGSGLRCQVLCLFNHVRGGFRFSLLSLSIQRIMILLLKFLSKELLELCVWSLLGGNDQDSNWWKERCDPQPTPQTAHLQPTGGWVVPLWENIWLERQHGSFPRLPSLLSWPSLFQESVPQASPSVIYNKELKEKTLQENNSVSDSENVHLME